MLLARVVGCIALAAIATLLAAGNGISARLRRPARIGDIRDVPRRPQDRCPA